MVEYEFVEFWEAFVAVHESGYGPELSVGNLRPLSDAGGKLTRFTRSDTSECDPSRNSRAVCFCAATGDKQTSNAPAMRQRAVAAWRAVQTRAESLRRAIYRGRH